MISIRPIKSTVTHWNEDKILFIMEIQIKTFQIVFLIAGGFRSANIWKIVNINQTLLQLNGIKS